MDAKSNNSGADVIMASQDDEDFNVENKQIPGFSFFGVKDYMNKADGNKSVLSTNAPHRTTNFLQQREAEANDEPAEATPHQMVKEATLPHFCSSDKKTEEENDLIGQSDVLQFINKGRNKRVSEMQTRKSAKISEFQL